MPRWRTARPLAVLALAGAATLAGCGSSSSAGTSPTSATSPTRVSTPTAASSSVAPSASASSSSSSASSTAAVRLPVAISNGRVQPNDSTVTVHKGQQVSVVITSDRATEVHVHGYDLHIEAVPGTVTRTFTANQTGTFEIETHDPAFTVYELQVD